MLKLIAFIIIAPLLLVLLFTLFSFVVSYQRSNPPGSVNTGVATKPCGIAATTNVPTNGFAGTPISLTTNINFSTCTDNLAYEWTVSDENENLLLQGRTQNHTYKMPGTYRWEIKIKEGSIIRYQANGRIEIKSPQPARLIVTLFSGFGNGPNDENGMTTLLSKIKEAFNTRLGVDVFAAVFTHDNARRGGENDPNCEQFTLNFRYNRPHKCALSWISALQPQPQDKIVFIGHSYGGNRARLMCRAIESEQWNHNQKISGLITIDAIDWDQCSPLDIADLKTSSRTGSIDVECNSDCNQSRQTRDVPSTVAFRKSYTQTQGVFIDGAWKRVFSPCLKGYGIDNEGVVACSSERHDTIDDNPAIHREIMQFLTSILSQKPPPASTMVSTPCPTPKPASSLSATKEVVANPGKFTEIGFIRYCASGPIKMIIKPSTTCEYYITAGGLIWRPNEEGNINVAVGSDGMNKSVRVWLSASTITPVVFKIDFIEPENCH